MELAEALLFPERERDRVKQREYSRRSYARNAEKAKQYSREYYQAHREEIRARKRAWYKASRDRILAQQKEYRERKRREAAKQGAGGLTASRFLTPFFTPYVIPHGQKGQDKTG